LKANQQKWKKEKKEEKNKNWEEKIIGMICSH
jgi:hypothetical protein